MEIVILFFLLNAESVIPAASWLGVATLVITTIIGGLVRAAFANVKKDISDLELRCSALETDKTKLAKELAEEKLRRTEEIGGIKESINQTYLLILDRMDDLKKIIYDARK